MLPSLMSRGGRRPSATPDGRAGLAFWLDPLDLVLGDGAAVSAWGNRAWPDLSPAQATAANQPTFKASAINGRPAVKCTRASNQFLSFPAGALGWWNRAAGATLLAVVQPLSTPVASVTYLNVAKNTSVASRASLGHTSGPLWRASGLQPDDASTVSLNGAGVPTVGTPIIHMAVFDWLGGTLKHYVNGAADGATVTFTPGLMAGTDSFSITVGGRSDASTAFDGYIGRVLGWNRPYSRAEMDAVHKDVSAYYGIGLTG